MDDLDPFGPLTTKDQIRDIVDMFDLYYQRELYPLVGKIVKTFGYDIALFTFGQLRSNATWPNKVFPYVMKIAKTKYEQERDTEEKESWTVPPKNNHKFLAMKELEQMLLSGDLTMEEFEAADTVDKAEELLERKRNELS